MHRIWTLVFLTAIVSLLAEAIDVMRATIAADAPATRKVTAADMPRIPHTDADDALKTFRLAGGFQL